MKSMYLVQYNLCTLKKEIFGSAIEKKTHYFLIKQPHCQNEYNFIHPTDI